MNEPHSQIRELRRLEPSAWTSLFQGNAPGESSGAFPDQDLRVTAVETEPLGGEGLRRYLLTFAGHTDSVPFIGKVTNEAEAAFYRQIGPQIPRILAPCWLSHAAGDQSWILLADVPNNRPLARWAGEDVEKVITMLASFHGAFWCQEEQLLERSWLKPLLGRYRDGVPDNSYLQAWRYWDSMHGTAAPISSHAIQSAGRLAPTLIRAAAGLQLLRHLGGWPGVISRTHLEAVADLLDDPMPMLQPLRELPATLLHGNLSLHHWHLTLWNDRILFDWRHAAVGPPILDLVDFLENVELLRARRSDRGAGQPEVWPAAEETMVDSYLVRMHVGLPHFDARAMRQTIPAAHCLHVLTRWFPRFAEWFQPFAGSPLTWQHLTAMSDHELYRAGFGRMAEARSYLSGLLPRFWHAAKQL